MQPLSRSRKVLSAEEIHKEQREMSFLPSNKVFSGFLTKCLIFKDETKEKDNTLKKAEAEMPT